VNVSARILPIGPLAFVVIEQRVSSPMLPLGLFRRRDFTAAQIAAFAISHTFFAIYLCVTLYLENVLRLSPLEAGVTHLPGTMLARRLRRKRQAD